MALNTSNSEPDPDDLWLDMDTLSPTESPSELLDLNKTQPERNNDDLVRIVGGRECKDGECPWQVTGLNLS